MKVSKRQLRRIIREEKRKMIEGCGDIAEPAAPIIDIVEPTGGPELVAETGAPEGELVVEMELASRALEQVVESVQNAAHLCPDCVGPIAAQAQIMEAMVAQAEALQEMVDAQAQLVSESAEVGIGSDVVDITIEEL
jgi:hypothetical protein